MGLKNELVDAARRVGGSFKTVSDRVKIVERFTDKLREQNIQIKSIDNIKSKYIESYIQSRLESGISKRTLQNEMSALRQILVVSGREKLATSERLSTKSLNLGNASRDGTKTAMSNDKFEALIQRLEVLDRGVAVCAALERWLGLRSEESVQSVDSLKTWEKQLSQDHPIRVIKGTKGGRPRDVRVVNKEMAQKAVKNAIALVKAQNGWLVDKPDLKSAMNRHSYCMRQSGATGKNSAHSLRYRFAVERVEAYKREGFTHKEALALTSTDLGHGDGRGTYVAQVYSKV